MARSNTIIANQVLTGSGADAASRPTIAFGDTDTGFYESEDDKLGVTLGGTARFFFSGSEFVKSDGTVIGGVTDDSVKSQHILDGAIVNADISGNAQITLNKLADGTQGQVLFYNSASEVSGLAVGTSGQVLSTQGAAADPVWITTSSYNPQIQLRNVWHGRVSGSSANFKDLGTHTITGSQLISGSMVYVRGYLKAAGTGIGTAIVRVTQNGTTTERSVNTEDTTTAALIEWWISQDHLTDTSCRIVSHKRDNGTIGSAVTTLGTGHGGAWLLLSPTIEVRISGQSSPTSTVFTGWLYY